MATFRLMTWNVQNLFLPEDDDGPDDDTQFEDKLESLAAVINQAKPAVLALQEVGRPQAVEALQERLVPAMPHACLASPDRRGIRVGFLSIEPLQTSSEIGAFPDLIRPIQAKDPIFDDPATQVDESVLVGMSRPGLEIGIDIDGTRVTIITAHFKSKLISYARQKGLVGGSRFNPNDEGERYRYAAYALFRRTTDASTVRERLNQVLGGAGQQLPVVFMGDLNDEPDAATTQIVSGPSGSELPVGDDHEALAPIPGNSGFARPDKGDGDRMWNLTDLIPRQQRVTRVFKGRGEVLDHIFVSRALLSPANVPTVTTMSSPAELPSMPDDPNHRRTEPGSDHAAVVAQLNIVPV